MANRWQDPNVPTKPKKRPKPPRDVNQLATYILEQATAEESVEETKAEPTPEEAAHEAAVSLGRRGGLKGGKARAQKLSKSERSEIAKKAAQTRWSR